MGCKTFTSEIDTSNQQKHRWLMKFGDVRELMRTGKPFNIKIEEGDQIKALAERAFRAYYKPFWNQAPSGAFVI
jgi:hypothetical protein